MKRIFLSLIMFTSALIIAGHHEESQPMRDSNFAVLSSYTIAAGTKPSKLEKELLEYISGEEERGFNNCGLLRHQFGSDRAFYSYCYFEDYDHLAEIMDNTSAATADARQTYSTHIDNIVSFNIRNIKKATKYVVWSTTTFGPYLTAAERKDRAIEYFDYYDKGFGGCNMMEHGWGPEMAFYFVCGFDSYKELSQAMDNITSRIDELYNAKLDILDHSDEILIRVER